jgi:hypothetical protein
MMSILNEKKDFRRIYNNEPNSLRDSSLTRGQIKKRKIILESPNFFLLEKIKIFDFESHSTS